MKKQNDNFNPQENYELSKKRVGYLPRKKTPFAAYKRIGFMSGLEVHQQLKTDKKLFCRCPAGIFQKNGAFDAELIRHMRPTLSELGEYDGTALMEFRTRKNITYRIANRTTCTYDIDDTPPHKLNMQALEIAMEISLLLKSNIVGELHITRKQYLDGSIPAGFQRTGITGIEGHIPLKKKKVKIIQLSIEEDSCREISDVGHERVYITDRLGMPLVEIVTYPEFKKPDEVAEAAQYIRFLTRSTGKVRTGIGAARQDVNVSVSGGTRVEIKGVAHISRIPELTHNEAFRQVSFLEIRKELLKRIPDWKKWKIDHLGLDSDNFKNGPLALRQALKNKQQLLAVNLPGFRGILSFFNQPGRMFADEISDRLKVIACLEKPNMIHSEEFDTENFSFDFASLKNQLKARDEDAQVLFWADANDVKTALETIEERCLFAFQGVPNETRKSLPDGTTIFERVLPGADRMYPDTDTAPIPIPQQFIDNIKKQLPVDIDKRIQQLQKWEAPQDTFVYLLRHNLLPLMERIITDFEAQPKFVATLLAHRLKYWQSRLKPASPFDFEKIYALFGFIKKRNLKQEILLAMLPEVYEHPKMEFRSVLNVIGYKTIQREALLAHLPLLHKKFRQLNRSTDPNAGLRWMMRELRKTALGNISLAELAQFIREGAQHD